MRGISAAVPDTARIKLSSYARTIMLPRLKQKARQAHAQIPSSKAKTLYDPRIGRTVSEIDFRCNVCGAQMKNWPLAALGRDHVSCLICNAFGRAAGIIHLLSLALHGRSIPLPDWPVRKDIKGVGLSDWAGYAGRLPAKVSYQNTFYHKSPRLDICDPDPALHGTCDFLISTDVFEHVPPPASRAFEGAAKILKPGGALVLTVPFAPRPRTVEHFPDLHDFRIEKREGNYVLINRRKDGRVEEHRDLVFHGGPGSTLEMRIFGRDDLLQELNAAGFIIERFLDEPVLEWGIMQWEKASIPILARKPG